MTTTTTTTTTTTPTPRYRLPDLRFDPGALEPHMSGAIVELHHGKHHKAYVDGANKTLEALAEARGKDDFARLAALEHQLAFHVSGHVLHSLFWQNLTPRGGGEPDGALAAAIRRDFGGFAPFKKQLVQAASTITGSGWAALVWDPVGAQLLTAQLHDHQSEAPQGSVPIMVVDAWEHAWYLQYQTDKASYFQALWNLWSWADVAARFEQVRKLDLGLPGAAAPQ